MHDTTAKPGPTIDIDAVVTKLLEVVSESDFTEDQVADQIVFVADIAGDAETFARSLLLAADARAAVAVVGELAPAMAVGACRRALAVLAERT